MSSHKFGMNAEINRYLTNIYNGINSLFHKAGYNKPYFIAGGSVYSALMKNENYKDIDVYFESIDDAFECRDKLRKLSIPGIFGETTLENTAITTSNTETFKDVNLGSMKKDIQIITCVTGKPDQILRTFDLKNSMCGITHTNKLIKDKDCGPKIKVEFNNFNIFTLSRALKYYEQKGSTGDKEFYNIIEHIINNFDKRYEVSYDGVEVKSALGECLLMSGRFLSIKDFGQYIHDFIVRTLSPRDCIEKFKKLTSTGAFFPEKRSSEFFIAVMDNNMNHYFTNDEQNKAKQKYPEFFI